KPTPKVLSSSDGKTVVVVGEDMQLTKDITVQITTYQTPVSAPAYQVLGKNNINSTEDLTPSLAVLGGASLEVFDSGGMPTTLSSDEFQATIKASTTQILGGLGEALNAYTKPMNSEVENITAEAYTKFQQQLNTGKMALYTMVYDPSSGSWSKAGAAVVKPYTIRKKVFDDQGNFVELKEYTKYALTTGEGVSLPTFAPFAFVLQYKSLIGQVSANVVEGGYKMSDGSIVSAPDSQSPDFNWIGAPVNGVMGVCGENQAVNAGLTGPPPTPGPDVYADLSGDGAADVKLSFISKAVGATVYIEYNNQIKQYTVPSSDTSVDNPYDWAGAAVAGQTGSWSPPAGYTLNPSLDIQPPEQPVKVYGDYAPGSGTITLQYKTPYMSPVIDVIFKKEGYFDTTLQINVLDYYQEGFPTKTVTMYRLPDTASIEGYVREKISQDPIGGALVSLMNPDVLDSIDTAQDDEAGMILSVEKKPNAQYVWEYRKQNDGENATWIKLEPQEANSISSSLIRTTVINNWDQNSTADPSGAYDLRVKVTHAYDNDNDGATDTTYVEEALGHFELLVDQNKLKQLVTGTLSESVKSESAMYGIYGGSSLGWYQFAGTIANEYTLKWTTTIQALASEAMFNDPNTYPNVFQDELLTQNDLFPVYVNEIFKSQPYEDAFYPYAYVLGYLSQNFMTLLEDDPNNPGKPYYESGFTVKNTATYTYIDGAGNEQEVMAASYFDLPEDALTEAEQLLLVPELSIVPNTTFAYLRQIYSKEDGFYRFNLVPYEYNEKLEIAGEKQGYAPDYKFVNDLAKGQVSHYDLYLEAFDVPAQAILFTYEEDKQVEEGTWTSANPDNAVKWQYLNNPESVSVDPAFVDYAAYPDEVTDSEVYTDYQAQLKTDANGTILWTNESANTATLIANSQEYPVYAYLDGEGNVQQIDSVDPSDGDAWIDANGNLMFTVLSGGTPTVALLPAYEGSRNLWFGNTANGVFKEGTGTYGPSYQDSIVSPVLDLSNFSFAALEFKTWFEAESVDIAQNQYDQMLIEATVVNDTGEDVTIKSPSGSYTLTPGQWKQVGTMNPSTEPGWQNQSAVLNYSSGGPDAMPIWINKAINLHPFAGHKIQLRFRFLTQDGLYNYFRGWAVDYLQILNEAQIETPPQVGEISESDQSLGRVNL
ncbi:MAG: immune inhibitor A, partial [Desulfohalobiaceae bacterium]|nr:immune inhibitor A [Desulfohalobiaceae bacterium]